MKSLFSTSVIGLCFTSFVSHAQFAPPVGQPGTTAMYKDSSAFVNWANAGSLVRGYQDITLHGSGYANVGDSASAFGIAGTTGVVSLGDGGSCTLQFSAPITDGNGPDFAVFENSFDDNFLELAFVEVSSDGVHFFRFPATSNTDTTTQTGSFGYTDATKINNLAGKYRGGYGTPFDLADIPNNALLNKQAVTHVKITDVVGCIQNAYCTRDASGHKVNDPWPTAFGSGGFDLDAVGVIHQQTVGIEEPGLIQVSVFPNPVTDLLHVSVALNTNYSVTISNLVGETIQQSLNVSGMDDIDVHHLSQGVYFLTVSVGDKNKQVKFIKRGMN
jgi:hypothetical protein